MKYLKFVILLLISSYFFACRSTSQKGEQEEETGRLVETQYAKGFSIEAFDGYRKVTVHDPWQKAAGLEFHYYLVPRNKPVPEKLASEMIIRTPVKKVVCLSTTHIGFISVLHETSSVVGLSGAPYVSNPDLIRGYVDGQVAEVGYDQGLNYELILSLKPDLVMAYGVGGEINSHINKLRDLDIPVVLNGEYLEKSPLAKTEWIKFVGAFYDKETEADRFFSDVEHQYNKLRLKLTSIDNRPKVLTGLPYKDAWWMAGGRSNLSQIIWDAGAEFLWSENKSREAFVVSLEDVFMRSSQADFWINCGTAHSIDELLSIDSRFEQLRPLKERTIYNNNARMSPGGGNDYWELGVVRPDLILRDLVGLFHPDYLEEMVDFTFYKEIN